jgi:hypothetical protein
MPSRSSYGFVLLSISITSAPAKTAGEYLGDAKDYALAPLHWDIDDWEWVAGAAASVASAYAFDGRIRDHFATTHTAPDGDPHSLRDATPTAALTLGTLAFSVDPHGF